jgi:UDP-N-acetylglucosamine 2-epimerase
MQHPLIVTDLGGIQEAPSLGKPVLLLELFPKDQKVLLQGFNLDRANKRHESILDVLNHLQDFHILINLWNMVIPKKQWVIFK